MSTQIRFSCDKCTKTFKTKSENVGKKFKCTACGEFVVIIVAEEAIFGPTQKPSVAVPSPVDLASATSVPVVAPLAPIDTIAAPADRGSERPQSITPNLLAVKKVDTEMALQETAYAEPMQLRPNGGSQGGARIVELPSVQENSAPPNGGRAARFAHKRDNADEPTPAKRYLSLYRKYADQPLNQVFAVFPYDRAKEKWDARFERLASELKQESWDFVRPEFKREGENFPVLRNYLNFTFLRIQDQNKIRYSADGKRCCFNTGLQTESEKDVFLLFKRAWPPGGVEWDYTGFCDTYDIPSEFRTPLPELATYVEDSNDLVFNIKYDIDTNIGHILDDPENMKRLPPELRDNRMLALTSIEGATKFLRQRVLRNYRTTIPFWFVGRQKVQLLLPLFVTESNRVYVFTVQNK